MKVSVGRHGRGDPVTVDERDPNMIVLLFVRQAWGIGRRHLPPLDPAPDVGTSSAPPEQELRTWERRWWEHWDAFHRSDSRRDRFTSQWQGSFGDAGLDLDALHAWREAVSIWPPQPLRTTPEWLARRAVLAAQDHGLWRVLVLPSAQPWFEARDSGTLLVSRALREDHVAYAQAIEAYG